MFQVRTAETASTFPAPHPESDAESGPTEPVEQDELLDCDTAVEQSEWL